MLSVDWFHGKVGSYTLNVNGPENRVLPITNYTPDHHVTIQFNGLPRGTYTGWATAPAGCDGKSDLVFHVSGK
jgi:hypothetical protein